MDLFLTSRPSLINMCEAIPVISDHEIVFIDFSIAVIKQKPIKRIIQMLKNADITSFKDDAKLLTSEFNNTFNVRSENNNLKKSKIGKANRSVVTRHFTKNRRFEKLWGVGQGRSISNIVQSIRRILKKEFWIQMSILRN